MRKCHKKTHLKDAPQIAIRSFTQNHEAFDLPVTLGRDGECAPSTIDTVNDLVRYTSQNDLPGTPRKRLDRYASSSSTQWDP